MPVVILYPTLPHSGHWSLAGLCRYILISLRLAYLYPCRRCLFHVRFRMNLSLQTTPCPTRSEFSSHGNGFRIFLRFLGFPCLTRSLFLRIFRSTLCSSLLKVRIAPKPDSKRKREMDEPNLSGDMDEPNLSGDLKSWSSEGQVAPVAKMI